MGKRGYFEPGWISLFVSLVLVLYMALFVNGAKVATPSAAEMILLERQVVAQEKIAAGVEVISGSNRTTPR